MLFAAPLDPRILAAAATLAIGAALALGSLRPGLVVRHARGVLAATALLGLAATACLVRLDPPGIRIGVDPSAEPLLPADDPARPLYQAAVRDFGDDEVYVVAITDDGLFTAEGLARLRRIHEALRTLPGVRSVQSLVDVTTFGYDASTDAIEVRDFVEALPSAPAALAALRARALADPLFRRALVSEDGRTAALNVSFRKMNDADFIAADLDGRIAAILAAERAPGVEVHVAGRPHVKSRVYHTIRRDLLLLVPLAVVAMAAVLALVTGSAAGVLLPLGIALLATGLTFAALAVTGRPLTILTTLLGPNGIVIGSVYGVHVLTRFREDAEETPDAPSAATRCLEHVRVPVLISGATTAVGFASLLVSNVPAVLELGAFEVLYVGCVTALSLTTLPAALALLPARSLAPAGTTPWSRLVSAIESAVDRFLAAAEDLSVRRARPILVAATFVTLGAAALIPSLRIDTDYLSFFREGSRVRRDFAAVNERLAGAVPLYVVFEGGGPGTFREPAALAGVERVQRALDAVPGVTRTVSAVDTLRVLNRAVERDDPAEERLPPTRAATAELIQLLPKGDTGRLLTVDQARANLVVRTGEVGSESVLALAARIETVLAGGLLPPGLHASVTGNAILLSRSADLIARQQLGSVGLAAATIFGLVAVALRSLRLGAIAMVPNVVPVVLFFGLLGAGVAPLSLPTSLIASVALGISVDDTMHVLARYREERRRGRDAEEATRCAARQVGRGMLTASVMLTAGFAVIALSGFATLRQFGLLSAWTMAVCLATDLILLPALLAGVAGRLSAPRDGAGRTRPPQAPDSEPASRP